MYKLVGGNKTVSDGGVLICILLFKDSLVLYDEKNVSYIFWPGETF